MTINLNDQILELDGKPAMNGDKPLTVGLALANVLVLQGQSSDPLRAYLLAKKLTDNTETLELDDSDKSFLKDAVEKSDRYLVLVKGQLLSKFV